MTKCNYCSKDMSEVSSCSENVKVDFGSFVMDPIRYGYETRIEFESERCPDCNIMKGGIHHPGCATEECPNCHKQLIFCSCLDGTLIKGESK